MDSEQLQRIIQEAVKILEQGGLVIFPTDTAFGIGCRIDDEEAVKKLYSIRKRPVTQAPPVLVGSVDMAQHLVTTIPKRVKSELIENYWPGALTIVLPCMNDAIPSIVRGGGVTIGIRMPNHQTPLHIIQSLGIPIIGTSANFHGESTPFQLSDINPQLHHLVDYIVPGVCSVKRESTVIDCTEEPWKILRQGAITV